MKHLIRLLILLGFSISIFAQDKTDAVKQKIESTLGITIIELSSAPVDGLLEIITDKGVFYVSPDGKYFIQGRIFNLDKGMLNETEVAVKGVRLNGVNQFEGSTVEFKAPNEKYVVNVFTDVTCGFCQRMHKQMDQYNALGITLRYLGFPRGGLNSQSHQSLVSVWCAEDPQQAMTAAKAGESVPSKQCINQVDKHYAFGQMAGVTGTPNILLSDGSMIGGYQTPEQLLATLKTL
jgi:thiol:disulfide interchange protein DsbC